MNEFALIIGIGASLGLWQVSRNVPAPQISERVEDGLLTLLGSLLSARMGYVLIHSAYYTDHMLEALQPWKGGLSWIGAAAGVLISVLILARVRRIPFDLLADRLAPLFPPLVVGIWLGCWTAGCAYGPAAPQNAFWGFPCADETGNIVKRFPLQFSAASALLIYFGWLTTQREKFHKPGKQALYTALGIFLTTTAFSIFRADPVRQWAGIRTDFWWAALFTILTTGIMILFSRKSQ